MLIEAAFCQEYERKGADAEVQEHWAYVEQTYDCLSGLPNPYQMRIIM